MAAENAAQKSELERELSPTVHDVKGNLMLGTTSDNPTPRWILIE
jgi:hypothetical protein